MDRIVYTVNPGNFKELKTKSDKLKTPDIDEVQVSIKAIGLNFADVFSVLGLYSAAPKTEFTPGLEFSGIITEIGSEVTSYQVGDKVMGVTRFGAFATGINIDASYVIHLPKDWSYDEGSAYLVQVMTAYYGLINLGNLQNNMNVLIHSAAGGVGIWANRIAKKYNCYTIGTVGSSEKLDLLKIEGYDKSIVRNETSFEVDLDKALDNRPLHIIMESIGGRILQVGYNALAPMGRSVVFGSAHYGDRTDRPNYFKLAYKYLRRPKIDPQAMISENKSIMGFNLIYLFEHVDLMHDVLQQIKELDLGRPVIGHTYPFEDLPDALRCFQGGQTKGKVVIQI